MPAPSAVPKQAQTVDETTSLNAAFAQTPIDRNGLQKELFQSRPKGWDHFTAAPGTAQFNGVEVNECFMKAATTALQRNSTSISNWDSNDPDTRPSRSQKSEITEAVRRDLKLPEGVAVTLDVRTDSAGLFVTLQLERDQAHQEVTFKRDWGSDSPFKLISSKSGERAKVSDREFVENRTEEYLRELAQRFPRDTDFTENLSVQQQRELKRQVRREIAAHANIPLELAERLDVQLERTGDRLTVGLQDPSAKIKTVFSAIVIYGVDGKITAIDSTSSPRSTIKDAVRLRAFPMMDVRVTGDVDLANLPDWGIKVDGESRSVEFSTPHSANAVAYHFKDSTEFMQFSRDGDNLAVTVNELGAAAKTLTVRGDRSLVK